MGALDVLKFWKVRFAILMTIVGIVFGLIAIVLFENPATKTLAVILLATQMIFILIMFWAFWSIITNPPDLEVLKKLIQG